MENTKELKQITKEFTVYDFEQEESFLEEKAAEGWFFTELKGTKYHFEYDESREANEYLIDFYTKALDDERIKPYNDRGFILVHSMNSNKDGVWYYFARPISQDNGPKFHQNEGRLFLLNRVQTRLERVGLVLIMIALTFFIFMFIRERQAIYLLSVVFVALMGGYMFKIYRQILQKVKEIKSQA